MGCFKKKQEEHFDQSDGESMSNMPRRPNGPYPLPVPSPLIAPRPFDGSRPNNLHIHRGRGAALGTSALRSSRSDGVGRTLSRPGPHIPTLERSETPSTVQEQPLAEEQALTDEQASAEAWAVAQETAPTEEPAPANNHRVSGLNEDEQRWIEAMQLPKTPAVSQPKHSNLKLITD